MPAERSLKTKSVTATGRASVSRNPFPTVRDWIAEGARLRRIEFDKYDLGDWWNAWQFGPGRKKLVDSPSWCGAAYQTCRNAGRVAHRFPPAVPVPGTCRLISWKRSQPSQQPSLPQPMPSCPRRIANAGH